MADIKDSVGESFAAVPAAKVPAVKAANQVHDITLVQAMLRVVKNAKAQPYLAKSYDGVYGEPTRSAIVKFQDDQKIGVPVPDAKASTPVKLGPNQEWSGTLRPGGPTIAKLSAMLPPSYKTIRVLPNTKTAYLEGVEADAKASAKAIRGDGELDQDFRGKVAKLVDLMYERHRIVLAVAPQGGRRTFAQQAALSPAVTQAGPGESNHNFGRAVDLGFRDLRWVTGDGAIKKDDPWLNSLSQASAAKAQAMWTARDQIALSECKVFKTSLAGDVIHLQAYNDAKISMTNSLANLLSTVGKMHWKRAKGVYQSDLGGKTFQNVGNAKTIWKGEAPVTKEMIATAKTEAGKAFKPGDVTAKDIAEMKAKLKGDFELADQGWQTWQPKQ